MAMAAMTAISAGLVPPVDQPVSQPMQIILITASYIIWVGLVLYSIYLGYYARTPFYTFLVIAAGYGGLFEPLYDDALMLYFYRPGQISLFTSFNIPQPIWVYSGYATLYASVALFFTRDVARGMKRADYWKYCLIEFLTSCAFEMIAINGGAYEYWGPHVFRIFKYPICIGLLETVQVISFATFASHLQVFIRDLIENNGLTKISALLPYVSIFILFQYTFMGSNLGVGAPLIISLHSSSTSEALVTLGSIATILGVGISLWVLSYVVPLEGSLQLNGNKLNGTSHEDQLGNGRD